MTDTPNDMPAAPKPSLVRQFASGVIWTLVATIGERALGLLQAILIARMLGIEDYGRYGLLFVTVGWISSVAGLQLGLTSTVEVARHRDTNPARARAVVRLSELVTLATVLVVALLLWLQPEMLGVALLRGDGYATVMVLAGVIAMLSVLTGVQDSVVQGYEDFQALAIIRTLGAAVSLILVVLLARGGGLDKVMLALTLAAALRLAMVLAVKELRMAGKGQRVSLADVWQVRSVLWSFSLPSMLISAVGGLVTWYGMLLVSGAGFDQAGLLTAGQQWRAMALVISSAIAGAAAPMLTRSFAGQDHAASQRLHTLGIVTNVGITLACVVVLLLLGEPLLGIYGEDFRKGTLVFTLLVATAVPSAYVNAAHQTLIGASTMWHVLWLNMIQFGLLAAAYMTVLPQHGVIGYGWATLLVTSAYGVVLWNATSKAMRLRNSANPV